MALRDNAVNGTFTALPMLRREIGTPWRALNPGQQALLVLVYLRKGEPFAQIGAGFDVSTATCWRYVNETVELLAAQVPQGWRRSRRSRRPSACELPRQLLRILHRSGTKRLRHLLTFLSGHRHQRHLQPQRSGHLRNRANRGIAMPEGQ